MLKPKALLSFLEQATEKFVHVKNIFIANPYGHLIASNLVGDKDKTSIACFTNIWSSFYEIIEAKFSQDNKHPELNFCIIDYEKGKIALTSLCGFFIMGIYTESSDLDYGILFAEIKLLKEKLEPSFKIIAETVDNEEDKK